MLPTWLQSLAELVSPRHLLVALRFLPVLVIVVAMLPTWILWPVLPARTHIDVNTFLDKLIAWTKATKV
ncbi:hypothetical protein [Streptomyces fractus]|uniref:hypothetical protein n=1 Tax=Streptomyces fractus TaxID=641806 RepID=UPI003CEE71FA